MTDTPETNAVWQAQQGMTPACAAAALELCQKLERERDALTIDARIMAQNFKAAANTILSDLIRKWEAEGARCGKIARDRDDEFESDGNEWRERRTVYFECAEELKAALAKIPSTPKP
jgi:hypothetical protein